jgi:beta-glucosidase
MSEPSLDRRLAGVDWGIATGHAVAAPPSAAARAGTRLPADSAHARRWSADLGAVVGVTPRTHRVVAGWPHLQPDGPDSWCAAAFSRVDRALDAILERGDRAGLTLFHLKLPGWLERDGGWLRRDTALRFRDYAERMRDRFADRVDLWVTSSDLSAVVLTEYVAGLAPTGRCLGAAGLPAAHHLLLACGLAAQTLRSAPGRVGTTITLMGGYPATSDPWDRLAVERMETWAHRLYLDPMLLGTHMVAEDGTCPVEAAGCVRDGDLAAIAAPLDVLGLSWHCPSRFSAPENLPQTFPATGRFRELNELNRLLARLGFAAVPFDDVETSASGWPIIPEGLADALAALHELYGGRLPSLHITDNGMADPEEPDGPDGSGAGARRASLAARLSWLAGVMDCGIDVSGYEYWSKRDNLEWRLRYAHLYGGAVPSGAAAEQPAIPRDWVHEDVFGGAGAAGVRGGVLVAGW